MGVFLTKQKLFAVRAIFCFQILSQENYFCSTLAKIASWFASLNIGVIKLCPSMSASKSAIAPLI